MMLLVGLGNPGQKYLKNRHNIGFTAIEKIASYYKFSKFQKKFRGKISEGKISGQKIIMLKPETFMNESGIAVQAINGDIRDVWISDNPANDRKPFDAVTKRQAVFLTAE